MKHTPMGLSNDIEMGIQILPCPDQKVYPFKICQSSRSVCTYIYTFIHTRIIIFFLVVVPMHCEGQDSNDEDFVMEVTT